VAFYLFAAFIILTSWMTDNSRTNYASSAPTPTHHSMHDAAAASSGAATR
jgi:hypothetical protein